MACLLVTLVGLGACSSGGAHNAGSPTSTAHGGAERSAPTTAPARALAPIAGMTIVSDGNGPVGYALTDELMPRTIAAIRATNAKTLIPVTRANGTLVGYEAEAVGFIPLSVARAPNFDVEDLRAKLDGGCEPQIGDPTFKQKYPRCPPPSNQPAVPTLGRRWAPFQSGFGQVRPSFVSLGGDPTGELNRVQWQSWGGTRAVGKGVGFYEPPGKIVADSVAAPATVVAFKLGNCQGTRAYQAIEWFFPAHGGTFDTGHYINICTGDYVGGGMTTQGR